MMPLKVLASGDQAFLSDLKILGDPPPNTGKIQCFTKSFQVFPFFLQEGEHLVYKFLIFCYDTNQEQLINSKIILQLKHASV